MITTTTIIVTIASIRPPTTIPQYHNTTTDNKKQQQQQQQRQQPILWEPISRIGTLSKFGEKLPEAFSAVNSFVSNPPPSLGFENIIEVNNNNK